MHCSTLLIRETSGIILTDFDDICWFLRCLAALVKNNPEAIRQCRDSTDGFSAVLTGKIDNLGKLNMGENEGQFDEELEHYKVRFFCGKG